MKKLSILVAFVALLVAGSGVALYEAAAAQHKKPAEPAQPVQPPQPKESRPAPPAQPREGRTAPPDTPATGQAVPRPPEARNEPPDRPRRGPGRPERIVIPYPGWPWWGYPYPYRYPPSGGRVYADWETADIRIDVSPRDAQVYVDGFYAGVVDDFDGIFQHLTLHAGPHLIEIRKPGYATLVAEFNLYPWQSITYRRTMEPSRGDRAAAPEVASAPGFEEGAAPPPIDISAPPGEVRFDVTPGDAAIYADGFYAGIVDDFNGTQHLLLAPGRHHVVLKMEGYESIDVDLSIDAARTITYRATLKKLGQP